jgi:hypothetical protein
MVLIAVYGNFAVILWGSAKWDLDRAPGSSPENRNFFPWQFLDLAMPGIEIPLTTANNYPSEPAMQLAAAFANTTHSSSRET